MSEYIICEQSTICPERFKCGGSTPHTIQGCDPCPLSNYKKCVPVFINKMPIVASVSKHSKLPPLIDVISHLELETTLEENMTTCVYETIKKLGNFSDA